MTVLMTVQEIDSSYVSLSRLRREIGLRCSSTKDDPKTEIHVLPVVRLSLKKGTCKSLSSNAKKTGHRRKCGTQRNF